MKLFNCVAVAAAAIAAMFATPIAQAQPAAPPVAPVLLPFTAEPVIPDTTWCGIGKETREFAACAAGRTNEFLHWAFNGGLQPPKYAYVSGINIAVTQLGLDRDLSIVACAYGAGMMENHFCNNTVHLGEKGILTFPGENRNTEVGVALIAAHEAGHYVQTRAGGVNLTPIFQDARVFPFEQWSDCAAGVALWHWHNQGLYEDTTASDAAEQFAAIGVEGEPSHGGPAQRREAVLHGYDRAGTQGILACGPPETGLHR